MERWPGHSRGPVNVLRSLAAKERERRHYPKNIQVNDETVADKYYALRADTKALTVNDEPL